MSSSQTQNLLAYMTGNAHVTGTHIPSEKIKRKTVTPATSWKTQIFQRAHSNQGGTFVCFT